MKRWMRIVVASSFVLVAASCGSRTKAPGTKAPERQVDVNAEIRQAMQHYADLVQKMDNAGIAALFTDNGMLITLGQKPVQGSKAIKDFLDTFKQYHVQSETITVRDVQGTSQAAKATGRYDQKVQLPAGSVVEVHGGFAADWVRGKDDVWRIARMTTYPDKQGT